MTVAVSTSSALDQLASLVPATGDYKVLIAVVVITLITIANLRGLRESGNIFAVPTYVFVALALGVVGFGLFNMLTGHVVPVPAQPNREPLGLSALTVFLLSAGIRKRAPWRSPASRRSPTACRRSSRRSPAMPGSRWSRWPRCSG